MRAGDAPAQRLGDRLTEPPLGQGRLKTGTPPRIDGRSIDYSQLAEQPGDQPAPVFSFLGSTADHPRQLSCWITHTSECTHELIRGALHRSPMYSGKIEGIGPRYCPSIEDKVVRFADKDSHQIFVEPEGLTSNEIYPNGLSTSLPFDIQLDFIRSIKGFERAVITRPGYAIEYDYFDPRDITPWLETKEIAGLFFAGQINGTTGYEEAAAQGLLAGINAARRAREQEPWYPRRDEAYIGVMVDDLVTRGTAEPYRMFTSRAEYRLMLREDNADLRLTPIARELGLVDDARWARFEAKHRALEREQARLDSVWLSPERLAADVATEVLGQPLRKDQRLSDLLRRPELDYARLMQLPGVGPGVDDAEVIDQLEISARYRGYIDRQQAEVVRHREQEDATIPAALDYALVRGLSSEVRQKLASHRPHTVGQAARIAGVTPAAISLLLVHLKKSGARQSRSA